MSVRFQADADLNHTIVKATLRREPSMDFQSAHAAGLVGLSDPEVLELAAEYWSRTIARPCPHTLQTSSGMPAVVE